MKNTKKFIFSLLSCWNIVFFKEIRSMFEIWKMKWITPVRVRKVITKLIKLFDLHSYIKKSHEKLTRLSQYLPENVFIGSSSVNRRDKSTDKKLNLKNLKITNYFRQEFLNLLKTLKSLSYKSWSASIDQQLSVYKTLIRSAWNIFLHSLWSLLST